MDVEKFVRRLCRLVLRHQMPVWNYFVNSFYSVEAAGKIERATAIQLAMAARDKHKKALFGKMEIERSEDDGEESNDDSDSDNGNDSEK
jgi:hypothetical protein